MLVWHPEAWEDYLFWQQNDKKTLKRINMLIKDVLRSPFEGLGKPEKLKGNYATYWSRRIDAKNRLVYRIVDEDCQILECRNHYEDH